MASSSSDKAAAGKKAALEGKNGPKARRFPRFPMDVRIQLQVFREGTRSQCWGRTTELGQDGIGATVTGDLQVGETVSLEIPLPLSAYPLKVRAVVRYSNGLHYGFEFLTLTTEQRDRLQRVCHMLALGVG